MKTYSSGELTPVERHGGVFLKRDDLHRSHGASGGKARTCLAICRTASVGVCTAGSRHSPQVYLVATMAKALGLRCVAHVPSGDISSGPVARARSLGAEIIQHRPGYNAVIVARAREWARERGYAEVPFGMECAEAVVQTSAQVANLVGLDVRRVVVPVGSGMSLAGILAGMDRFGVNVPVLGVVVGADPRRRLDRYAPVFWERVASLCRSHYDYGSHVAASVGGVSLDPVYEAKCAEFLAEGDLLWVVGHRDPAHPEAEEDPA